MRARRTFSRRWLAVLLLSTLLLAGCSGAGSTPSGSTPPSTATGAAATSTPSGSTGSGTVSGSSPIPAGRSIREGGGGPVSYTFREEWRRALAVAQQWRKGAYLITASGTKINDNGVPSSWLMKFVDAIPADAVLMVEIDPWGKVTAKREVKTSEATDLLQPGDAKIPFGVIDSDAAVAAGKRVLAPKYNLSKTKSPSIGLTFRADHTGPYWTYLVEAPGSKYLSAKVNALTGAVGVGGP